MSSSFSDLAGRLREAHESLLRLTSESSSENPERTAAILKKRAAALATSPENVQTADELRIVDFKLAAERYAIETTWVKQAVRLRDLTPVPHTPAHIAGVTNLRGTIISVVNLMVLLGIPTRTRPDLNKVIFLQGFGMEFGCVVDEVVATRSADRGEFGMPQDLQRSPYIAGVSADGVILIDAPRLLADSRLTVFR